LQHTVPTLQVVMPQVWLVGYWIALSHAVVSHAPPGRVHVPQLGLQQTSPVLQVFGPQGTLSSDTLMPHTSCEHFCPGATQVPQLALQQTLPSVHTDLPHASCAGGALGAGGVATPAAGFAPGFALAGAAGAAGTKATAAARLAKAALHAAGSGLALFG
jgi:hypothetical protein